MFSGKKLVELVVRAYPQVSIAVLIKRADRIVAQVAVRRREMLEAVVLPRVFKEAVCCADPNRLIASFIECADGIGLPNSTRVISNVTVLILQRPRQVPTQRYSSSTSKELISLAGNEFGESLFLKVWKR